MFLCLSQYASYYLSLIITPIDNKTINRSLVLIHLSSIQGNSLLHNNVLVICHIPSIVGNDYCNAYDMMNYPYCLYIQIRK